MSPSEDPLFIYSDGACSGNPGPGGWAVVMRYPDGRTRELGGAVEGLKAAGHTGAVVMVTDSEYLRKGITEWIHGWKRRGWRTAAKKPVLNQDLWRELDGLNSGSVEWRYTRAHAGDPGNERCDEIAHAFSQGWEPQLT